MHTMTHLQSEGENVVALNGATSTVVLALLKYPADRLFVNLFDFSTK